MKSRFFVSISSLIASTIMLATAPAEANVFYDMEFFDEAGELVGTGEFSHDETPFEGDFESCADITKLTIPGLPPFPPGLQPDIQQTCSDFSQRFEQSQDIFRLNSFSTTVGLRFDPVPYDLRLLFWEPSDVQPVFSIVFNGPSSGANPFPSFSYSDSSWGTTARFSVENMTATTWLNSGPFDSRSGTWTATRRSTTSIPETTPVVGLLALGGVSLMMVSKRQS